MTTCERLDAVLVAHDSTSIPSETAAEHLLECARCRSVWLAARVIGESPGGVGSELSAACPDPERLVDLIDGLPSGGRQDRRELIEHLDGCRACLGQTLELIAQADPPRTRELATPPAVLEERALALSAAASTAAVVVRFRRKNLWLGGLVAAAGLACVSIGVGLILPGPRIRPETGSAEGSLLRGTPSDAPRPVAPIGVVNDAAGLEFSWDDPRPEPADQLLGRMYHLVVVDLDGGTTVIDLNSAAARHVLTPSEAARFEPGGRYHWLVEPVGEGSGTPSAAVEFRLAAR